MGRLDVRIKTLTPLWTGGVEGTMDRIHETGILGSLRWWYEAIVRGLGGYACDPTEHKCSFDADKYRKSKALDERQRLREAGLCDACQVFGATGWRRRFRLEVVDGTKSIWDPPDKMLNIRPPDRTRGWYLPPGKMGTLTLKFTGDPNLLSLMAALLLFLEKWGALGSKSQLGYGVFTIENRDKVREWVRGKGKDKPGWKWETLGERSLNGKLPDLRRFGFFRYKFHPQKSGWWTWVPGIERVVPQVQPLAIQHKAVPVTPALKNEWRFRHWRGSQESERAIFGSLRPRQRSKVSVSWAYFVGDGWWEVRGWAWLANERWAEKAWKIIGDVASWERALKTKGKLEKQRIRLQRELLPFLEATI